jgi:hypothetical protein
VFALGLRLAANELGVDPLYLARGEGFSMTERFAVIDKTARCAREPHRSPYAGGCDAALSGPDVL